MNLIFGIAVTLLGVIINYAFRSKSKTNKYKYFTKLLLQIFEEKHADFPFQYSYWLKVFITLPKIN